MTPERLLIQRQESGTYRVSRATESGVRLIGEGQLDDLTDVLAEAHAADIWLLVPASFAPVRRIEINRREARFVRRTIPFQLEDQLLQDVDSMHFAIGRQEQGHADVIVVDAQWLASELQQLASNQLKPSVCLSEQSLLPSQPDCLGYWDGSRLFLRHQEQEAPHVFDIATVELALSRLRQTQPELAELECLVEPGIDVAWLRDQAARVGLDLHCRQSGLFELAASLDGKRAPNLLQGKFAPRIDWEHQWRRWRAVAAALAAAMVLQTATASVELYQQRRLDRTLRAEIEGIYRELYPRGNLVDPVSQLRTQLDRLQAKSASAGFMQRFFPLGEMLAEQSSLELHSLRFDGRDGEIRLDLSLPSHQEVESLRRKFEQAHNQVDLRGSTLSGGVVRARMAIR